MEFELHLFNDPKMKEVMCNSMSHISFKSITIDAFPAFFFVDESHKPLTPPHRSISGVHRSIPGSLLLIIFSHEHDIPDETHAKLSRVILHRRFFQPTILVNLSSLISENINLTS